MVTRDRFKCHSDPLLNMGKVLGKGVTLAAPLVCQAWFLTRLYGKIKSQAIHTYIIYIKFIYNSKMKVIGI